MSVRKIKEWAWPFIKNFRTYIDIGALDGDTSAPFVKDFKKVIAFEPSPLTFPKSTKRECREVPRSGVFGIFGAMEEQCFNIEFPETNIDFSLLGGGKAVTYILESDLKNGIVNILADSLPTPSSIEDIQYNYEIFETMEIGVDFE